MGNVSQINRSRNSVRVEQRSDLNESDLDEVYCMSKTIKQHFNENFSAHLLQCRQILSQMMNTSLDFDILFNIIYFYNNLGP